MAVTKEMAQHMPTVRDAPNLMQPLRDYITATDDCRYDNQAEGLLRLDVTHSNLVQRWHDIKFHEEMTILEVKEKLYRHGGTPCSFQELFLRRGGDTIFLMDERKTLGYYGARNGMEIHIKDTDPHSMSKHGGLEDVSQVEKYVMPDEEYDKMKNTVRAIKRERAAQAQAEKERRQAEGEDPAGEGTGNLGGDVRSTPQEMTAEEIAAMFPIGSRCECEPGARRGEVRFTGKLAGMKGLWVGVCLDEPQGQNDGTKDGRRYFECPGPSYGCFLKPPNVQVGDFPERDPFASDAEDDEF